VTARRGSLRRFARNRAALVASGLLALLVGTCLLWPVLSPWDPNAVDFARAQQTPSTDHPLGTDSFGRDLFTRMAEGGRFSLFIAAAATALILLAGTLYGTVAGVAGGKLDEVMMRLLDGLFALPRFPFYVAILSIVGLGGNVLTLVLALSAVSWLTTARLVRGQLLSVKQRDFVRAARAIGARGRQVALRHLVPNSLGILLVAVLLELPAILLAEALVSVLGLGLNPPQATWGTIAQDGQAFGRLYEVLLPSLAIAAFAVCVSFVADGVDDALDPRRAAERGPGGLRRAFGGLAGSARRATVG
jgi:oligopeptide transport system permease protein